METAYLDCRVSSPLGNPQPHAKRGMRVEEPAKTQTTHQPESSAPDNTGRMRVEEPAKTQTANKPESSDPDNAGGMRGRPHLKYPCRITVIC